MILRLLEKILNILLAILDGRQRPPKPGPLKLVHAREEGHMHVYTLSIPDETASDVTSHEITTTIGSASPVVTSYPPDTAETAEFLVDPVLVSDFDTSYVQIDRTGNRSEAVDQTFTVSDTQAPPKPGELGLNFKREE